MTLFGAWCRFLDFAGRVSAKAVRRYQTRMALRHAESCGTGLKVNHPSRFRSRCRFGNNCNFNGMTVLGRGRVTFGDNFHSGENCRIITSNHNYDCGRAIPYDETNIEKEVVFGDNVWLGDSVIVVGNVTVGEGAIIGAGSVVSKDIPPLAVVGGNPARVLKYRDHDHYWKLKAERRFC